MFYIYAFLSGLLYVLSYEYIKIPYLIFIAFVPLLIILLNETKLKKIIIYCFITLFTHNLFGFFWVAEAVKEFGELNKFYSYLVLTLYSSFTYWSFIIFGISVFYLKKYFNSSLFMFFILPSLFVISEFLDFKIFYMYAGSVLILSKYLYQIMDILGANLLSFIVILINVCFYKIYIIILNKNYYNIVKYSSLIVNIILVLLIYGIFKENYNNKKNKEAININASIIQGNIGNSLKLEVSKILSFSKEFNVNPNEYSSQDLILKKYISLSEKAVLDYPETQFIIWPETAFPGFFTTKSMHTEYFLNFAKKVNVPFFLGAYSADFNEQGFYNTYYNSIVHIRDDINLSYYNKTKLLPFSEKMPFSDTFKFLKNLISTMGDFGQGTGATVFNQNIDGVNIKFAPLICYEILIDDYFKELINKSPNLIVNVTNDSWFGAREPYNHFALARVKAVEYRIPIIRATNTGISAFIDINGKTITSSLNTETILNSNISLNNPHKKTFYYHFGYYIKYLLFIIISLLSFIKIKRQQVL